MFVRYFDSSLSWDDFLTALPELTSLTEAKVPGSWPDWDGFLERVSRWMSSAIGWNNKKNGACCWLYSCHVAQSDRRVRSWDWDVIDRHKSVHTGVVPRRCTRCWLNSGVRFVFGHRVAVRRVISSGNARLQSAEEQCWMGSLGTWPKTWLCASLWEREHGNSEWNERALCYF